MITEVDPICALQAAMEGYEVVTMEHAAPLAATSSSRDRLRGRDLARALPGHEGPGDPRNIGHFDSEIQVACARDEQGDEEENIKPQVDQFIFPNGKRITLLARGRLVNLGCATGHPSFVMSNSFSNQTIAQMALWANATKGKDDMTGMQFASGKVYVLPKKLDEKVARLHLAKVGVQLTKLSKEQAEYLGVPVDGPFKPDHYRY